MEIRWQALERKCVECGIDLELFIQEKFLELEERKRILLTPPKKWFSSNYAHYNDFASKMLQRELSDAEKLGPNRLAETASRRYYPEARQNFEETTKRKLLEEAEGRCVVCGVPLTERDALIDHRIPLIEGGSNHSLNLQVLCKECNTGKADYFAETAQASARPWWEWRQDLISGTVKLSTKKRFCVLMRDVGVCRRCGATAKEVALKVVPRLPAQEGGQFVYDNLWTLCERCLR